MTVHQLLSFARRGDAVTHQALALRDAFGSHGPSRILAHAFDDSVADAVEALHGDDAAALVPDDALVLYHVTIGCAPAVAWLRSRAGPYGLVHHNITPQHFFEGLSWDHARLTEQGRAELAVLAPHAATVIADSAFNAAEIESLGGTVDVVHPPISTTRRLADIADDARTSRLLRRRNEASFVHIGQLLPHKRPHQLVQALHLLISHLGVQARLTLIGATPVPAYLDVVTDLVDELAPGRCELRGLVPDEELATRLRRATALVTTSAHEGFCVPVVEAMAMGTPVLACDAGAVAETAGDAALLLPADAAPTLVAEALSALATDERLRTELRSRGLRRAEELEARIDLAGLARTVSRLS